MSETFVVFLLPLVVSEMAELLIGESLQLNPWLGCIVDLGEQSIAK
jgi:hypothetical protein